MATRVQNLRVRRHHGRPEEWTWIPELSAPTLQVVARATLTLIRRPRDWVHRRVETFTFVDETVVRRHLSVDFTLPKRLPTLLRTPDGEPVYFVPLTFLARQPGPMHYDVRDEAQQALPLLTEHEHSRITAAMLYQLAIASARRGRRRAEGDDALAGALAHLPFRSYDDALPVVRAILNPRSEDWLDLPANSNLRHWLRKDKEFADFLSLVAAHSVAIAPVCGPPGRRRVLKLAFEEEVSDKPREKLSVRQRIGVTTGFLPRRVPLQAPLIGAAETQHYQVSIPRNVVITEAGLTGDAPRVAIQDRVFGPGEVPPENQPSETQEQRYSKLEPGFAARAHLYVPRSHRLATGLVWVGLRAERRGWLVGALVASVFIAVALIGAALLDDTLVNQPSSATSILLLVPGLTAAYMARPGEHPLATRLLRFPRFLLALSALSSFVAAGALLALTPAQIDRNPIERFLASLRGDQMEAPDALFWTLVGLAGVAVICSLLLALSVWLPRAQRRA